MKKINVRYKIKKELEFLLFSFLSILKIGNKNEIIIIGHQKSGTSIISALLSYGSRKSLTNDIRRSHNQTTIWESLHFKKISLNDFIFKYYFEMNNQIIKEPELSFFYHDLKIIYEGSKFVFVLRSTEGIIKSILSRLGVNKNSDDIFNEEFLKRINKAPLWVNILGKDSIENKDSNGIIRNLCERIEEINAIYINDSSSMVLINYDEFIKNKFETVKNLFINLDIDIKSEKAIKDNVDQQFQRKGQSNSTECFYSEAHMEIINEKSHNYRKILNETRG